MSDFLLELGERPAARKVVRALGLPIPLPESLRRAKGPYEARPLADRDVVFGAAPFGELAPAVAETLAPAGANPLVIGDAAPFREVGEAFARPPRAVAIDELRRVAALVFDASGISRVSELASLYEFFHPLVPKLGRSGRIVVVGRPGGDTPERAAAQRALEGFVRSLAKEVGRKGSTAQLVRVAPGAEDRVAPVLRWLISDRSAFVSGQPLDVDAAARRPDEVPVVRPLEGRTALVTGAARGIGAATAARLADEGAHVVCLDRPGDEGPLSQVARTIGGEIFLCDVSAPEAPTQIAQRLPQVDVVVHNAGVTRDKTIARMKPELWHQAIDINLRAVAAITEALVAGPLRDDGRVVCLSSVAGIAGNMGQTNYAASKAGIVGFVEALASRVAGRGITVNAIAPGFIETRLTAAIPTMIREAGRRLSNLGQGGLPADVAEAILFLSTPGAAGITGRTLRVCGGALIGA